MNLEDAISLAKELAFEGEDYDTIKRKIQPKLSDDDLKIAMRMADEFIVDYELATQEKSKVLNYMIIGVGILLLGIIITSYTIFSGASQYIISYGAILGGAWFTIRNFILYQKPIEDFAPRKGRFRKRF